METTKLTVRSREERGSAAARRMRREGELPANLTGLGMDPLALAIPEHAFELAQQHGARLVELDFDGEQVEALIREIQYDTFGDRILHVDLDRIARGHKLEVETPFDFFGTPAGADSGGIFQVLMDTVTVECLPSAIPENIEVDVRKLEIGDEIRIRDVLFPEGVVPVDTEEDELVALVSEPQAADEEAEEGLELEEAAEGPAVIGEEDEGETKEED
jgi:large subunit ribosomal protein L25